MTPGYYYCCCDSFGRSRPKRQQRSFDPIHDLFCLWGCFTRVRRRRKDFPFLFFVWLGWELQGIFRFVVVSGRACAVGAPSGFYYFHAATKLKQHSGVSCSPSSPPPLSFFCVAHFTGVCVHLNGRAQQQFTLNYRSDGWKEGKRDTEKRQPRTYYTSPQTLDVHSVLLRWVANSTRNSPHQTNQQTKSNTFCFSQVCAAGLLETFL